MRLSETVIKDTIMVKLEKGAQSINKYVYLRRLLTYLQSEAEPC